MKPVLVIVALVALETAAVAQPSAEDLYAQGQTAYDAGDYAAAVVKWQASYDLSKENALLFNLAQAKRLASDCAGALATYRRFTAAAADPASEQHKLAEDLARELDAKCPEQKPPGLPSPSTVADSPAVRLNGRGSDRARSGRAWKITGLATGGVGVATLAVGLGLGRHGASIGDEITAACQVRCDWTVLKDKEARGKREVAIGKVLDLAGVAAIAGGAIFYYLGTRREAPTVAPVPGGGSVVSWRTSW